uniref:ATP synthase complex subunit 8 n=1 Tax=Grylloblatta sculleni TaxID=357321 RepID=Q2Q1L8_9NEOP|nr:ATP synthase F0 subunit 8 [Grylloblatta sculleni]
MPQMAPLSWLILFVFFLMILMLFNMMNYFCSLPLLNKSEQSKIKTKNLNWMW